MTNIALVVLDTLRKDAFDRHFDWLPGVRFENAYSTSHWTLPAHASLFTGKYPSEHGTHAKSQFFECEEDSLIKNLSDSGYTTRAFSTQPMISRPFKFDRNFSEFEGGWRLQKHNDSMFDWYEFARRDQHPAIKYSEAIYQCIRSDSDTVPSIRNAMRRKLRESKYLPPTDDGAKEAYEYVKSTEFGGDEFLFMNIMEAHEPYAPPRKYQRAHAPRTGGLRTTLEAPEFDPDDLREAYGASATYCSNIYQKIFQEMSSSFDYIITLADHGELLGEYNLWQHMYGLHPELVNVPLSIYGGEASGEVTETVSIIDIPRTIQDMVGIDMGYAGQDLLNSPSGRSYITESMGLREISRDTLTRNGHDPSILDQTIRGIATDDGSYGAMAGLAPRGDEDDWMCWGSRSKEALRDDLNEKIDCLNIQTSSHEHQSAPEGVISQLKDLGYT